MFWGGLLFFLILGWCAGWNSLVVGLIALSAFFMWLYFRMAKAERERMEEKQYYAMCARLDKLSSNVKSAKHSDTAQRRLESMRQQVDGLRGSVPHEWSNECDRYLRSANAHAQSLTKAEEERRIADAKIREYQRQQKEQKKAQQKAEKHKNLTPEQIAHREFMAQQRRLMTDSLRYDVMRRDGFRCKLCGMTANDGVKLHVDHIIAVSKGGKTELSNLRTLCERCNLGKSDKSE